jgi:hypothetical protein
MERTAEADTYRIALLLQGAGAATGGTPNALAEILRLDGTFAGDNHAFTASGFLATFLGADPDRGLQALRADGTSYVRGPLTFVGAPDEAWYRLEPTQAALANPPVSADATLGLLTDADFSGFVASAPYQSDGQRCTPFSGDRTATTALLQSLSASGLPAPSDPAQVDAAESRILVCADGYIHALSLVFSGTTPSDPPAPFSYDLAVELDGFDETLAIDPPADARPLPTTPLSPGTGPTP